MGSENFILRAVEESLSWNYELSLPLDRALLAEKLLDDLAEKGIHLVHASSEFMLIPVPIPDALFGKVQDTIETGLVTWQGVHPGREASANITDGVFDALINPQPPEDTCPPT